MSQRGGRLKAAFFRAIKRGSITDAWARYAEARTANLADKYMTSALITSSAQQGKANLVQRLWKSARDGRLDATQLDARMCSDFIRAFGKLGDRQATMAVLESARRGGLANAQVYNTFLTTNRSVDTVAAVSAVEDVLQQMRSDRVSPDAFTNAIAIGIFGDAGRLDAAQAILDDALPWARDTVAHNALLRAAARAVDVQLALDTLQRMEEHGPPPDLISYNHMLLAIAKSRELTSQPPAVDSVAAAQAVRERLRARGMEEDSATLTHLLQIFGDSPLAEELIEEYAKVRPALSLPYQDPTTADPTAVDATMLDTPLLDPALPSVAVSSASGVGLETIDLRGLTSASASLALSKELSRLVDRAAERQQSPAMMVMSDWQIVTGRARPDGSGGGRFRDPPATLQATLRFLLANRINVKRDLRTSGQIIVSAKELDRVVRRAVSTRVTQTVVRGTVLKIGVVLSALAAFTLAPRLLALR